MKKARTKQMEPTLIFIRGIPGSGKSFLASHLAEKLSNCTVLDPDELNTSTDEYLTYSELMTKDGVDTAFHPFRFLRKSACDAIQDGNPVVWNQPFTKKDILSRLITYIKDSSGQDVHVFVIEVDIDTEVAYKRIVDRIDSGGHGPSRTTFDNRVTHFSSFDTTFTTIHVDGTANVEKSVQLVLDGIKSES